MRTVRAAPAGERRLAQAAPAWRDAGPVLRESKMPLGAKAYRVTCEEKDREDDR